MSLRTPNDPRRNVPEDMGGGGDAADIDQPHEHRWANAPRRVTPEDFGGAQAGMMTTFALDAATGRVLWTTDSQPAVRMDAEDQSLVVTFDLSGIDYGTVYSLVIGNLKGWRKLTPGKTQAAIETDYPVDQPFYERWYLPAGLAGDSGVVVGAEYMFALRPGGIALVGQPWSSGSGSDDYPATDSIVAQDASATGADGNVGRLQSLTFISPPHIFDHILYGSDCRTTHAIVANAKPVNDSGLKTGSVAERPLIAALHLINPGGEISDEGSEAQTNQFIRAASGFVPLQVPYTDAAIDPTAPERAGDPFTARRITRGLFSRCAPGPMTDISGDIGVVSLTTQPFAQAIGSITQISTAGTWTRQAYQDTLSGNPAASTAGYQGVAIGGDTLYTSMLDPNLTDEDTVLCSYDLAAGGAALVTFRWEGHCALFMRQIIAWDGGGAFLYDHSWYDDHDSTDPIGDGADFAAGANRLYTFSAALDSLAFVEIPLRQWTVMIEAGGFVVLGGGDRLVGVDVSDPAEPQVAWARRISFVAASVESEGTTVVVGVYRTSVDAIGSRISLDG